MYAFKANGSFRAVGEGFELDKDEIVFASYPTDEQLEEQFPDYGVAKAKREHNFEVLKEIADLEARQTDRRVREAVLGTDKGWLANLNTQIAALRATLE